MTKKIGKKYEEMEREREAKNHVCCERALEILLRNTKSVEDLDLVERTLTEYETEYGYDLRKYRKRIREMRNGCYQGRAQKG